MKKRSLKLVEALEQEPQLMNILVMSLLDDEHLREIALGQWVLNMAREKELPDEARLAEVDAYLEAAEKHDDYPAARDAVRLFRPATTVSTALRRLADRAEDSRGDDTTSKGDVVTRRVRGVIEDFLESNYGSKSRAIVGKILTSIQRD